MNRLSWKLTSSLLIAMLSLLAHIPIATQSLFILSSTSTERTATLLIAFWLVLSLITSFSFNWIMLAASFLIFVATLPLAAVVASQNAIAGLLLTNATITFIVVILRTIANLT